MQPRATARVSLECNNRCVFCGQAGVEGSTPLADQLATARARGDDEVTIVGGEPMLDPRLAERVALARSLGFRRVGLQTNGRRLGETGVAAALAKAGLTDVHLSIHGAEDAVHDYHTGVAGSLVEALAGLAAARANGLMVVVTTVLTRSNFRSLASIPTLLASRGVAAWLVAMPQCGGRLSAAFDRIMPRLGLAIPFALSALEAAEARGMSPWIAGAPRCLLGPFWGWVLPVTPRAFAPDCEGCAARQECPGLDAAYLERFGGDELGATRVARQARAAARDDRIARMFVGPGEVASAPALPTGHAAPRRVALPMLGKVRPGVAEANRASERRSGDALREILPALFDRREQPHEGKG